MKRLLSWMIVLAMLAMFLPAALAEEETVLFEGRAEGRWTGWGSWKEALNIGAEQFDASALAQPFEVAVSFEGDAAPMLIFMSWTGGNNWAQMKATYEENSVAYYDYEQIVGTFGSDFTLLNAIRLMPNETDVTITKVAIRPVKTEGASQVTYTGAAGEWVSSIHAGWNLGNSLDSFNFGIAPGSAPKVYETCWGNTLTNAKIAKAVRAAGFDAVRLPVTWSQHIGGEEDGFAIDEAWMDRVQQVVDLFLAEDFTVIINLHHDTGTEGWLRASAKGVESAEAKFRAVWQQICERFADYDNRLLFEGFNEILNESNNWGYPGHESTAAVNQLNQIFVDVVRATGGNNAERLLIVNTYAAANNSSVIRDFVLPQDTIADHLIVEVHCYTPWEYCDTIKVAGTPSQSVWTDHGGKGAVDGMLKLLHNSFTAQNVPVIIGEFAAGHKENEADRAEWAAYMTGEARKVGIACFWWDNGGQIANRMKLYHYTEMGLMDRFRVEWLFPDIVEALTGVRVENVHKEN